MDIIYIQDEPWEEPWPFQVPKWWECQWRRVGCGEKNCPMCGDFDEFTKDLENRSKGKFFSEADPQRNFEQGELEAFKKVVLNESILDQELDEEDYNEWLSQQPNLTEHPLYRKISSWSDPLLELIEQAEQKNVPWTKTEASLDLAWYASLIRGKVYRLLLDRWQIDHENKHMDVDYIYTRSVLSESLKIIKNSINTFTTYANYCSSLSRTPVNTSRLVPPSAGLTRRVTSILRKSLHCCRKYRTRWNLSLQRRK